MKKYTYITKLAISIMLGMSGIGNVLAATTPTLGIADTFGILSDTYTNTAIGTTINGDLGYTTGPALAPTVNGTTHVADAPYNQAGTDQGTALSILNAQPCDYNFGSATDLSLLPQPLVPGVYCVTGAVSIGAGGITLNGSGTYIFRMDGALTTAANSTVTLAGGASNCDVFWTPIQATTLGADSIFEGTDIDAAGITIGNNVTWGGRALAFGGTVSTDADTITVPICLLSTATLHVVKQVVNTHGGTALPSAFNLHVRLFGIDVIGSPAGGTIAPGTAYILNPGTYVVSEDANASYVQSFSGDCNANGSVTLLSGDDKTCTLTNTDIIPLTNTGASVKEGIMVVSVFLICLTMLSLSRNYLLKRKQLN